MKSNTSLMLLSLVILSSFFLPTASVLAQDQSHSPPDNSGGTTHSPPVIPPAQTSQQSTNQPTFTLTNPLKVNSVGDLIQTFVEIFSYIVILVAVVMFIVIGFKYILYAAQGNVSEISSLHKQLLWLVIGVAVVIGARVIIQLVINTLSATGTVSPGVIQSANNAIQRK